MVGYEPAKLETLLSENSYPGRGIVIGRTADGKSSVICYFIMGRSENSRNRVFLKTEDGIKTEAFDPAKLQDPSLIIYHPVRKIGEDIVVTNGDQTDTIRDAIVEGGCFEGALATREFEPDAPNFTPRISGISYSGGDYTLSILKSADEAGSACVRQFFFYPPLSGVGHFIHTYHRDGNPIPTFQGEPKPVEIPNDPQAFAKAIWESLNEDNKVSLYVRYQNLASGEAEEIIINKHQEGGAI